MKKNKNIYERELLGPDSYEYFNNISKKCQTKYIVLLKAQLLLLLIIAVISILPVFKIELENYKQAINIFFIVFVLALMILQFSKNYMEGWQKARFLSESILSNCWLLIFKCESYNEVEYDEALSKFQKRIKEMKEEININDFLLISDPINCDHDNPKWILDNYFASLNDKKTFYLKYRIENQINWYSEKSKSNNSSSTSFFILGIVSMILGIVLSILVLIKVIPNLSYLGFFTTLAASLFSWKQTKRFDELKTTYSVASDELQDFRNSLERENTEIETKEIILDTEKAISREHKLWFSRILN